MLLEAEKLEVLERQLESEAERRLVRKSLAAWARYHGFQPAKHHMLIIEELEKFVFDDEFDVLLFHAPPGSAKSTYISRLFPSWYFSSFPQNNILFATHSVNFAERWGRQIRNDITNDGDAL